MGTKFTQVEVTRADIERADIKKSGRCAVSTAIARMFPDARRIETDVQTIRFTRGGERFVYVTPYAVSGYVVAFDRGDEIHPFTFRLNETSRVGVKQRKRTPAGNKITAAKQRVKDRARTHQQLEMATKDPKQPTPSKAERTVAKQRLDEAVTDLESITAAYGSEQQVRNDSTNGERLAPKRVYKTGRREYGHRVLAINQHD